MARAPSNTPITRMSSRGAEIANSITACPKSSDILFFHSPVIMVSSSISQAWRKGFVLEARAHGERIGAVRKKRPYQRSEELVRISHVNGHCLTRTTAALATQDLAAHGSVGTRRHSQ